jgi:hypothetical protein
MNLMSIPDLSPPNAPPAEDSAEQKYFRRRALLLKHAKDGVSWFYWLALVSVVTTIIYIIGGTPNFFLGLGVNQLVAGYTMAVANGTQVALLMRLVGGAIELLLAGIFVLFGMRGLRSYRSWIVAGIMLYTLDGLIFAYLGVWLGVFVHAYVLYNLIRGLRALDSLNRMGPPGPPRKPASSESA